MKNNISSYFKYACDAVAFKRLLRYHAYTTKNMQIPYPQSCRHAKCPLVASEISSHCLIVRETVGLAAVNHCNLFGNYIPAPSAL